MKRILFSSNYDHRWPSGSYTAFKAGWSGPVKDEVAEEAIRKGRATIVPARPRRGK